MNDRLDRLRESMRREGLDGLIVAKHPNIRWLTGATGSACELLVTLDGALLLNGFVDITENAESAAGVEQARRRAPAADIGAAAVARGLRRVGLEAHVVSRASWDAYVAALPAVEVVPTRGLVEELRAIKAEDEIALIQQGMALNDLGMRYVQEHAREGISERQLALELEHAMREAGADELAFLLVQFGENAAKPHHTFSERSLRPGDFILIDIGAVCSGYGSDTTRTFIFRSASDEQRVVYEAVREAQLAALAAVRAGAVAGEVHRASAEVIAAAGYADKYGHSVGHAINEGPLLSPTAETLLRPGNVVTIEPGIYIGGWGGVRIEDTVVVTEGGYRNLASFPKELIIL